MPRCRFLLFAVWLFFWPIALSAAGGGGGGAVPTCTQDTWGCSDWSSCSSSGKQTRTCILSFDCPNLDTPRPAEEQSCTPPCTADTWTCTDWGTCSTAGKQQRACERTFDCPSVDTPKPDETRSCTPPPAESGAPAPPPTASESPTPARIVSPPPPPSVNCGRSAWTCQEWGACDYDGNQKRNCHLPADCRNTQMPRPLEIRRCDHLQCGDKTTLRERISCRELLSPAGVARELEIQYLPELCRAETDKKERQACISRYKSYQPCWVLPVGAARLACAKQALSWSQTISEQLKMCENKIGIDRAACQKEVKEKVLYLTSFRFYDLEQQAEDLILRGAPQAIVADFVALMETKKQEFNQAVTKTDHLRIIAEVQIAWRQFVAAVKDSVQ